MRAEWPLGRLRAALESDDVEYLAEPMPVVLAGSGRRNRIPAGTIIRVGGQYLVEAADDPDNWYMGELHHGEIVCWGQYGALEHALAAL